VSHSLLRSLIRETLLQESNSPTARAAAAGYAVVKIGNESSARVMIYSPQILFDVLDEVVGPTLASMRKAILESITDSCVLRASVRYSVPARGVCWDSSVVSNSVAAADGAGDLPRVGPAAYEAAMWYSRNHRLAPDRLEVSSSAEKVWKKYRRRETSGEVESLEFDNVDNPKTPSPKDDCIVHDDKERPVIDRAYSLKAKPPGLTELENKHSEVAEKLLSDYGFDEGTFNSALDSLFTRLFWKNYDG
jgi:hypothetical protein